MPTDFSAQEDAQFESDLQRARGYKPVTPREMRQAYKQYSKQGLKFGQVKKSQSDEKLYARAERIVLDWWKQQQKDKQEAKHKAQEQRRDPLKGLESNWTGGGNQYGGGTGGYSGGSGSGMLPDTAMAGPNNEDEGPQQNTFLNATEVRQQLRRMGVPETWRPPMAATRSENKLRAWAERSAERHDMILRYRGLRAIYDRGVVYEEARRIGVRVDARKIPPKYRTSIPALRKYLLNIRKAQEAQRARDVTRETNVDRTSAAALARRLAKARELTGRGFTSG